MRYKGSVTPRRGGAEVVVSKKPWKFIQTGGGSFILLPLDLRKDWDGAGDDPEDPKSDYAKTRPFAGSVGVVKVGGGTALILGTPLETAVRPQPDGALFVQRLVGEDDEDLAEAVDEALAATDWTRSDVTFEVGDKGRLALMDSYDTYADTEKEDRIEVALPAGSYTIDVRDVKDDDAEIELHLVRLRRA